MDTKDLKLKLENLYEASLKVDIFQKNHPIIVLDAVKSIIGISPSVDSLKLTEWLTNYINNSTNYKVINKNNYKIPEVISYIELEKALLNRDLKEIKKNIFSLIRVSDGQQILEYLLEFSLKYCSYTAHQFIWAIYRIELFFKNKYISISLLQCCSKIIDSYNKTEIRGNNMKIDWTKTFKSEKINFNRLSLYFSIYNTKLIRGNHINFIINDIEILKKIQISKDRNIVIKKNQSKFGRSWILEFLINYKRPLNFQLLIILNSCRSCLKLNTDLKEDLFWNHLNRNLELLCN